MEPEENSECLFSLSFVLPNHRSGRYPGTSLSASGEETAFGSFDPNQCGSSLALQRSSSKGWSVVRSESLSHTEQPLDGPEPGIPDADLDRLAYETEFLAQLGDRVREMRAVHGMSRRELSRRCGLSERYVAMIEAGKGNVSIVRLLRIALVFRCT